MQNLIPSLALMIFGLSAGELLKNVDMEARKKAAVLAITGVAGISAALICNWLGICPIIKKTWTSGFTLFSGGCCLIILATFYYIIDILRIHAWTYPAVIVGMNSTGRCMRRLFRTKISFGVKFPRVSPRAGMKRPIGTERRGRRQDEVAR